MSQERQVKQVSTHISADLFAKLKKKAEEKKVSRYRLLADIIEAAL